MRPLLDRARTFDGSTGPLVRAGGCDPAIRAGKPGAIEAGVCVDLAPGSAEASSVGAKTGFENLGLGGKRSTSIQHRWMT